MYNNGNSWYNQPNASGSNGNGSSWVQQAGYQTDRTGFGFKPPSGAQVLASLDDKVADADAKLRDFMQEIHSLETEQQEEKEQQADSGLSRSSVPGFVSGGHVVPATVESEAGDDEMEGDPLTEPTTSWQHLMDANTKHYYYWNTETNAVTWTIPQDYSEYLVRHKLYREAVAAGRKTLPRVKEGVCEVKPGAVTNQPLAGSVDTAAEEAPADGQGADNSLTTDEIGPQLPPVLKKLVSDSNSADSVENMTSIVSAAGTSDLDSTANKKDAVQVKPVGVVEGYESESQSETEELPPPAPKPASDVKTPAIKSLVAYDDSYNVNDDEETASETGEQLSAAPEPTVVEGSKPDVPSQAAASDQSGSTYEGYTDYNSHTYPGQELTDMAAYNGYNTAYAHPNTAYDPVAGQDVNLAYQTVDQQSLGYTAVNEDGTALVYGPQQAPHSFQRTQEAPLIFTGAPPPPPPPPEAADDKSQGLSSVEISDFSSVLMDKLNFLDVRMDGMSKLQLLLIQLKTRLDDWQAGGLSKQYLIEKLQETDGLLEVCETDSAPAGWLCNWSRKEKQYYFVHEISEELSWTYPEQDVEAVRKQAQQQTKPKARSLSRSGTLSHLNASMDTQSVDSELKALFLKTMVDKCADVSSESKPAAELMESADEPSPNIEKESHSTELPDKSSKSSKASKRRHSDDSQVSDKSHKRSKSKSEKKSERASSKHKKHSKAKKSKSSSKKSKEKKRHSRSSSREPGELRVKHESRHDSLKLSPRPRVKSPERTSHDTATRERLSKIFKLDHSGVRPKVKDSSASKSKTAVVPQVTDDVECVEVKDSSAAKSKVAVLPKLADDVECVEVKVTSPAHHLPSPNLSPSPLPPPKPCTPPPDSLPAAPDVQKADGDMDISPLTSREATPELLATTNLLQTATRTDLAVVKPAVNPHTNELADDEMDSFLLSVQQDVLREKADQGSTTLAVAPPPPPPPEHVAEELPPAAPEKYSRAAAPVFYSAPVPVAKPPMVANAPVLYTPAQLTPELPAVPSLPIVTGNTSPTRSPEPSHVLPNTSQVPPDMSKPLKEKHKTKKSKKSSKMPAALVQKWQKVQSEITTDIEKEQRLKHELLK